MAEWLKAHAWKAGSFRSHVKNIGHTKFLSKDELKYLKPKDRGSEIKFEIKAPTYFPTNERIEETPHRILKNLLILIYSRVLVVC